MQTKTTRFFAFFSLIFVKGDFFALEPLGLLAFLQNFQNLLPKPTQTDSAPNPAEPIAQAPVSASPKVEEPQNPPPTDSAQDAFLAFMATHDLRVKRANKKP